MPPPPPLDKPPKISILSRQPLKALYIIYKFSRLLLVQLPYWTIKYLPSSNRPRRSWSLKRTLSVQAIRYFSGFGTTIGRFQQQNITKEIPNSQLEALDARFDWIEAMPESLLVGDVKEYASKAGVTPSRIPGYWIFAKGKARNDLKAKPDEAALMHLHGGAFYVGSGHPSDPTANITKGLLLYTNSVSRVFRPDYRLSYAFPNPPANPFPASLLDSIAAYYHLIHNLGFKPQNITLVGDSAGGTLVLMLLRYIVENKLPELPLPGRALLLSPGTDFSQKRGGPGASVVLNNDTDIFYVPKGEIFAPYMYRAFLGPMPFDEAASSRWISPCAPDQEAPKLFEGFPPTYISAGGAERLLDGATTLAEKMKLDAKDEKDIVLDVEKDAIHDFTVMSFSEPERTAALKRIANWLDLTK